MRTTLAPKQDLLAQVRLFRSCVADEFDRLAAATTELDVSPGEVLCQEGQAGHEFFVVVEGQARVTMSEREIATLGPGSFFGEMALLEADRRTATVTATAPMSLIVMTRSSFRALDRTMPSVHATVAQALAERRASVS